MRIEYTLDKNDFLEYQLFAASQSDRIKRKRRRNRLLVPVVYFFLGIWFLYSGNYPIAIIGLCFAVLWFLFYPFRERRLYIKHFKAFVEENHKNNFGKPVTVELGDDTIFAKDSGSESKILTSELKEINEIPSLIVLGLKSGNSLIISKNVSDLNAVRDRLKELSESLIVPYYTKDLWQWK